MSFPKLRFLEVISIQQGLRRMILDQSKPGHVLTYISHYKKENNINEKKFEKQI